MASCKTCIHAERTTIDQQIIAGVPVRTISAVYGLSLGALSRHRSHVKQALATAMELRAEQGAVHSSDLLLRVEKLVDEAEGILKLAKEAKDLKGATSAIAAATRLLELIGKLNGELTAPGAGIHIHNRTTINASNVTVNSDVEIAVLIAEATNNFNPVELSRLRLLAESVSEP